MTVITWDRSGTNDEGLTAFNARRHLQGMAELVSDVFADELDASGHGALDEMRFLGRLNPLLGGLLTTALFSDFVLGYVWVEAGRVIGNVTFQRADFAGSRYRISNVAVYPQHRRRGIARDLMVATLREIADRGASWAVLQVRVDNPGARRLYEDLKFTPVCQDGVWERQGDWRTLAALPPVPDGITVCQAPAQRWRERMELARSARSALAEWSEPLQAAAFRPNTLGALTEALSNLTGLRRVSRWAAYQDRLLVGFVQSDTAGQDGRPRLSFDVRPEWRGGLEEYLLTRGLHDLAAGLPAGAPSRPPKTVVVEHSGDDAAGVAALEAAGFRPQRVLLTMRRLITAADAEEGAAE